MPVHRPLNRRYHPFFAKRFPCEHCRPHFNLGEYRQLVLRPEVTGLDASYNDSTASCDGHNRPAREHFNPM